MQGYREALETAEIAYDPALVRVGKWNEQSGYQLTHELMRLTYPPDALFCASDSIAVGALEALRELRLRVPEDISLVGFDNRHFAQYQRPPLTTIALQLAEMGHLGGKLLISAILHNQQDNAIHTVPCELVVRQSCGAGFIQEG